MKRKKISSDILLPDSELVKKDIETAIKRNIDKFLTLVIVKCSDQHV